MSLADKIIKNVKALPESKQIEILDFILLPSASGARYPATL